MHTITELNNGGFAAKLYKLESSTALLITSNADVEMTNTSVLVVEESSQAAIEHFTMLASSYKDEFKQISVDLSSIEITSLDALFSCEVEINNADIKELTDSINALNLSRGFANELIRHALLNNSELSLEFLAKTAMNDIPLNADIETLADLIAKHTAFDQAAALAALNAQYASITEEVTRLNQITKRHFTGNSEALADVKLDIDSHESGIEIIKAGKGLGKTSVLAMPMIKQAIAAGKRVVTITPRVSITDSVFAGVEGMTHYKSRKMADNQVQALNIVVNSIIKSKFENDLANVDLLVIDEIDQVLNHIAQGSVENKLREAVYNKLKAIVKGAKTALLLDADASDTVVNFVEDCGRNDIHIHVIAAKQQAAKITVTDDKSALAQIRNAVDANERILVATDIRATAEAVEAELKKQHPTKNIVNVTAGNIKSREIVDLLSNINEKIKDVDVLIFSPAITAAVSLEKKHFDKHFGLFFGCTGPKLALQQMSRDRTARHFVVGLANTQDRNFDLKRKDHTDLTDYDKFRTAIAYESQFFKNYFCMAFIETAKLQGFDVSIQRNDADVKKEGKAFVQAGRKLAKEAHDAALLAAEPATEFEIAMAYEGYGEFDPEMEIRVEKFNLLRELKLKTATADDVKLWKGGKIVKHLHAIELAMMSDYDVQMLIKKQNALHKRDRKPIASQRGFYTLIMETLGLDFNAPEQRFTEAQAVELLKTLWSKRKEWNALNVIPAKASWKNAGYANRTVGTILNTLFGIKTQAIRNGKGDREYGFNIEQLSVMMSIIKRRFSSLVDEADVVGDYTTDVFEAIMSEEEIKLLDEMATYYKRA